MNIAKFGFLSKRKQSYYNIIIIINHITYRVCLPLIKEFSRSPYIYVSANIFYLTLYNIATFENFTPLVTTFALLIGAKLKMYKC